MLYFFKNTQPYVLIVVLLYGIALFFNSLFLEDTIYEPKQAGFWADSIYNFLGGYDGRLHRLIAFGLVMGQAWWVNRLVHAFKVTQTNHYVIMACFVLACSLIPDFQVLSPALMANCILGIIHYILFSLNKQQDSRASVFLLGFLLAGATMLYFPVIYLYLFFIIGFILLNNFTVKHLFNAINGLVVLFFLIGLYYYLCDNLTTYLDFFKDKFVIVKFMPLTRELYFKFLFLGSLAIGLFIAFPSIIYKVSNHNQAFVQTEYFYLFSMLVIGFFQLFFQVEHFVLLSIPMAILGGLHLQKNSKPIFAELLHWSIFGLAMVFQYYKYI